jgi:hypothetical protein
MAKKIFGVRVDDDLRRKLKAIAIDRGYIHNSGTHKGRPDLSGLVLSILGEFVASHPATSESTDTVTAQEEQEQAERQARAPEQERPERRGKKRRGSP